MHIIERRSNLSSRKLFKNTSMMLFKTSLFSSLFLAGICGLRFFYKFTITEAIIFVNIYLSKNHTLCILSVEMLIFALFYDI